MIIFNRGFYCTTCGPIETATTGKTPKCKTCGIVVSVWVKPLNQRAGRCLNCSAAHFENKIENHDLVRTCRTCEEVYNIDTKKIIEPGKKEMKYETK